jgi:gluconokinase
VIVIVMGVVGAGKTTVGRLLASELGWAFADADDFHTPSNVEKIRSGVGLEDADREPWLLRLREHLLGWALAGVSGVLACSALKRRYRDTLSVEGDVRFVHLKATRELVLERLRGRRGHFASESILESQFRDLEEPKDAVAIEVLGRPEEIVSEIRARLGV